MTDDDTDLTVAQMSAATGMSAHTLRYYERAGLIRHVGRSTGNHRRYSAADVEWIAFLLRLRETGMSIAQMREYAQLRAGGTATLVTRLHRLEAHEARLHEQTARLHAHEEALAAKIVAYRRQIAALRRQNGQHDEHDE